MTGPDGVTVPVATHRSSARYDLEPGRAGRAVATFQATTAGPYRVSAARATEAGATRRYRADRPRANGPEDPGARHWAAVTVGR